MVYASTVFWNWIKFWWVVGSWQTQTQIVFVAMLFVGKIYPSGTSSAYWQDNCGASSSLFDKTAGFPNLLRGGYIHNYIHEPDVASDICQFPTMICIDLIIDSVRIDTFWRLAYAQFDNICVEIVMWNMREIDINIYVLWKLGKWLHALKNLCVTNVELLHLLNQKPRICK